MGNFFFKLAFEEEPKYYKDGVEQTSSTVSKLFARSKDDSWIIIGLINSSLFYYYWILFSDCYHLSKSDISYFPFDFSKLGNQNKIELLNYTKKYSKSIDQNSVWQIENKKDGTVKKYRRYFPQSSKPISDEIDRVLAKHYGFTNEELDFIINYDIKYRMGKGLEGEDEE